MAAKGRGKDEWSVEKEFVVQGRNCHNLSSTKRYDLFDNVFAPSETKRYFSTINTDKSVWMTSAV